MSIIGHSFGFVDESKTPRYTFEFTLGQRSPDFLTSLPFTNSPNTRHAICI